MAEGEFALVRDYLEAAGNKPVSARGLLFHDNELYSMYLDIAVQERDENALSQYAPLAEEMAVRDGHILYQASAHRAGCRPALWRTDAITGEGVLRDSVRGHDSGHVRTQQGPRHTQRDRAGCRRSQAWRSANLAGSIDMASGDGTRPTRSTRAPRGASFSSNRW